MSSGGHPVRCADTAPRSQMALDLGWGAAASLDAFHAGADSRPLHALRDFLEGRETTLYLYGGHGVGKTHLLQAACRHLGEQGMPVAYLPLGTLLSLSPDMLGGLQRMAMAAIDDVQVVRGRRDWQEELFHLFNGLRDGGGRILLAGAAPPGDLDIAFPDLVSRLQWGLVMRLAPLSDEEKMAALRDRAQRRGMALPPDAARYLLAHYPRDTATLFAMLNRLDEASLESQRRLTIPFIKEVLDKPR